MQRIAKQQPWYHKPLPRCDAVILRTKEQCVFSARYQAADGRDIKLCKIHAELVDFKIKRIMTDIITIER